jgi:hypothetical protein
LSGTAETGFSTFYGGRQEECLFDRWAIIQDSDGNRIIALTTRSPGIPTANAFRENELRGPAGMVIHRISGLEGVVDDLPRGLRSQRDEVAAG